MRVASPTLARRVAAALLLASLVLPLASCAYYNAFYLARKSYDKATNGQPYLLDKNNNMPVQDLNKSIELSKKVLAQYPKSKWVDDAYLMWAKSLLGKDDPLQTVNMLVEFPTRFPKSPIRPDALFFLGVAYRQSRKPTEALGAFEEFLNLAPKHALAPYALLERARVLTALDRPAEAVTAASALLDRFPKSVLAKPARQARSDALIAQGDFAGARADFQYLGRNAVDDEERFTFLLREADCLEGARTYDAEIDLLRNALSHEKTPVPTQVGSGTNLQLVAPSGIGEDRWGRLRLRIGTAEALSGKLTPALDEYKQVIDTYPRSTLSAEAQYRIGYAFETVGDDFDRARVEYAKVKEQAGIGIYATQASSRLDKLNLLTAQKGVGRDSTERKAEAAFLLAEQYLFQLDKPDRALEQYAKITHDFAGTPHAAKALNAQAWVESRKFGHKARADSLFWQVVHDYPATEGQLAARDYLEGEGIVVPASLIRMPVVKRDTIPATLDSLNLTPPPSSMPRLGESAAATADSLERLGAHPAHPSMFQLHDAGAPGGLSAADSLRRAHMIASRDSALRNSAQASAQAAARAAAEAAARRDSVLRDSTRRDSVVAPR